MALWNILMFNKVVPVASLHEIGDVQTNCDSLLIYKTEEYFGEEQVVLPLKEWRVEPKLKVWFDIVVNGVVTPEFLRWRQDVPDEIPALLKELQRRYRHTPMLPGIQDVILAQMTAAMDSYLVREPFESMLGRVQAEWEKLHVDWNHALTTLPQYLVVPAMNDNFRLVPA